jgi:hypothetical protein
MCRRRCAQVAKPEPSAWGSDPRTLGMGIGVRGGQMAAAPAGAPVPGGQMGMPQGYEGIPPAMPPAPAPQMAVRQAMQTSKSCWLVAQGFAGARDEPSEPCD